MEIIQTPIQGVLLVKPKVWGDSRGYFVETWHKERYETAGIDFPFVQDNHSKSSYGILRGLHFQRKFPQGKLVSVSLGSVFDVAVDIRKINAGKPVAVVDFPRPRTWLRRDKRYRSFPL